MAEITDLSNLINLSTGGGAAPPQNHWWYKVPRIAGALPPALIAGRPCSLWQYDGFPAGGNAPGAVEAPDNTTLGCLPFTSPTGGRQAWMTQSWTTGLVAGTLILYDRLLHIGGLSGTLDTAQTVGGAITRNTGGAGNFAFIEINTIIGTTVRTVTLDYTNQDGVATTSPAVVIGGTGFREFTRAILVPLASGDTGLRGVTSLTLSATTGTVGDIGVVVGKPIAYMAVGAPGAPGWRDFVVGMPGIPEIAPGACLSLLWIPAVVTQPELFGGYSLVEV